MARAEEKLQEALCQAPDHAPALLLKGVVHAKSEAAIGLALVERSVHVDPFNAEAWYNLGIFEAERRHLDAALRSYIRAVQLEPLFTAALGNGCELLRRFDRFEEALDWADRQVRLGRGDWAAHLNRAISLLNLRRLDEADDAFRHAQGLAGDRPIVPWETFALRLHQRRFAAAWDCFEQRFACGELNGVFAYPFPQPRWHGEPLDGRSILIHNEQGLGDQIMFACTLPEIIAEARSTTLVVAPELATLFSASFPSARVLSAVMGRHAGDHPEPPWLSALQDIDYQAPIGSLMALRRASAESFSGARAYLRPSDMARQAWRYRLDQGASKQRPLQIGLCWASNPALFRHDSSRRAVKKSMPLETMAPLAAVEGVKAFSVLNWRIEPMPAALKGRLRDLSASLSSLDDTAALIERLDLVITVDTAVAHLAGALGSPVWLLLHDFADCRWGLEGKDSYWYPTMRLFRQTTPGDWAAVVAEVRVALQDLVHEPRA